MCMRTQYEGVFFVARLEARQLIVQRGVQSRLVYISHLKEEERKKTEAAEEKKRKKV